MDGHYREIAGVNFKQSVGMIVRTSYSWKSCIRLGGLVGLIVQVPCWFIQPYEPARYKNEWQVVKSW